MPQIKTWACKQCGKLKRDSNHWFIVSETHLSSIPASYYGIVFSLMDREPGGSQDVVCGEACAQKELMQYLARVSAEKV